MIIVKSSIEYLAVTTRKICQQSAFTLIQLLFVIAIAAAATVYGLISHNNDIVHRRTDKVMFELQRILESAITYYKTKGQWPSTIKDLTDEGYLPDITGTGTPVNPWNRPYEAVLGPLGIKDPKFSVSTDVDTGNPLTRNSVALKIMQLLPNAFSAGSVVYAGLDSSNKMNQFNGALLVAVTPGIQIGTQESINGDVDLNSGVGKNNLVHCLDVTEPAQVQKVKDTCSALNRVPDYEVMMTGFNTGMVGLSALVGITAGGTPVPQPGDDVYALNDYTEVYVQKLTGGSNTWCFNFVANHPYSWDYSNVFMSNPSENYGVFGEVVIVYYCKGT